MPPRPQRKQSLAMHIEARPRRKHHISLTPLIDVVFILLLFFMLATNFTDWRTVTLATGTSQAATEQAHTAVVSVDAQGRPHYDGEVRDLTTLSSTLNGLHDKGTIDAIVVRPQTDATLGATVRILDALAGTDLPVALQTHKP